MTSLPSWALVDVGECQRCNTSTFRFTHSLDNHQVFLEHNRDERPLLACVSCHIRQFRGVSAYLSDADSELFHHLRANQPEPENYPFAADVRRCYACGYVETEQRPLTDATRQDDRTIIVQAHPRCAMTTSCCGNRIITGRFSHEGNNAPEYIEYLETSKVRIGVVGAWT